MIFRKAYNNPTKSSRNVKSIGRAKRSDSRIRTLALLSLFSAMAIIHWLPTVIYRIVRILELPNCTIFRTVANTFHWLGPILNPIMYSFMSAKFRRQLKWTLSCTTMTKFQMSMLRNSGSQRTESTRISSRNGKVWITRKRCRCT